MSSILDNHSREAIVAAFGKKLSMLTDESFERFVAIHDLKKKEDLKEKQKQRKRRLDTTLAAAAAPVAKEASKRVNPGKEQAQARVEKAEKRRCSVEKEEEQELRPVRQLSADESSFLKTLGKVCKKTTSPSSQSKNPPQSSNLHGKSPKKKQRDQALEELAEMQKRVEAILNECHEMDCECEECE